MKKDLVNPVFSNTPIPIRTIINVDSGAKFTKLLTAVVTMCFKPDELSKLFTSTTLFTSSLVTLLTVTYSP